MHNDAPPPPYTLYGGPKNRGLRVIWALRELGQPFELRDIDLFGGEQRAEGFLRLNPAGKVPALVDRRGGEGEAPLVVTESVAILNHLAEEHADAAAPLMPSGRAARAAYHQWMSFGATELEPPVWVFAKHSFIYSPDKRVEPIKVTSAFEHLRATRHLAAALADGRPFVLGEAFSAADIFLGQTLMWAEQQGLKRADGCDDYLRRLRARPALAGALQG
ncbi:MAG: glutathione S-transferase family protein [Deltaproteobacteria bacterium]|nr:glutathione S-transferase family protein [Deltaproteobacteria bacterium]